MTGFIQTVVCLHFGFIFIFLALAGRCRPVLSSMLNSLAFFSTPLSAYSGVKSERCGVMLAGLPQRAEARSAALCVMTPSRCLFTGRALYFNLVEHSYSRDMHGILQTMCVRA